MDGQVTQQSSSYRQGLVLGLTMAEVVLLLVFCLLIAMTTLLRKEQVSRQNAEEQLRIEKAHNRADSELVKALQQNPDLYERLRKASRANSSKEIDEFWRELVESRATVEVLKKSGLSEKDIRERLSEAEQLLTHGINIPKALRNAAVVAAIRDVMPNANDKTASPKEIADAVAKGLRGGDSAGHRWPPIIKLSEADGFRFKSGSAELTPAFTDQLKHKTTEEIQSIIKQFDVDIIEVVGHTDEQPLGLRQSNLDRDLLSVLRNDASIGSLVPADNAGLGLARAVSVVSVLLQTGALHDYKIIPLSGAQLVNNDESLAIKGKPGDIPARRRIEIRLRKSASHETSAGTVGDTAIRDRRPATSALENVLSRWSVGHLQQIAIGGR